MNKTELIDAVAHDTGLARTDATRAIESVIDKVSKALHSGEKVTLVGFGTFDATSRKARDGRNPRTGETIKIPASKNVKFKPGKELKESLNS